MSENSPVILVTGVGPGTGAAISRRFAQGGYKVAMLARTRERLDALQREMPNAKGYPCDVTDENQLDSSPPIAQPLADAAGRDAIALRDDLQRLLSQPQSGAKWLSAEGYLEAWSDM